MIQDIGTHQFDITFRKERPQPESRFFLIRDGKLMLHRDQEDLVLPKATQLSREDQEQLIFAFTIDGEAFFLLQKEGVSDQMGGRFEMVKLRELYSMEPRWLAFAAVTCSHMIHWYREHRYCGCCSGRMEYSDQERAMICEDCGNVQYPRISPVIMAAVTDGNRLLVTRYAGREYKGLALIAGFAEVGETLEAALKREVEEEVGLQVKNLQYFGSQPWGFSDSLISGFFAELDGSDQVRLDRDELSEAVWLSRQEIPEQNTGISITAAMIEAFRRGQR